MASIFFSRKKRCLRDPEQGRPSLKITNTSNNTESSATQNRSGKRTLIGWTTSTAEYWLNASTRLINEDGRIIGDRKEDIDTVLVVAGLFSAIVTSFDVELYRSLKPDEPDISAQILLQLSQQLTGSNSTISIPPQPAPSTTIILINIFWFSSLVCSLITASLCLLVKQWLSEYLAYDSVVPQERCRLRFFRHEGIVKWKVFEIASFLPLLLQIAIILFLSGLAIFAVSLHPVLGWIVTVLIAAWGFIFIAAMLAPLFSASCPYKSPFLKRSIQYLRSRCLYAIRCGVSLLSLSTTSDDDYDPSATEGREKDRDRSCFSTSESALKDVTEAHVRGDSSKDIDILVNAHSVLRDADILDSIGRCVGLDLERIRLCFGPIAKERGYNDCMDLVGPDGASLRYALRRAILYSLDGDDALTWYPWMDDIIEKQLQLCDPQEDPAMDRLIMFVQLFHSFRSALESSPATVTAIIRRESGSPPTHEDDPGSEALSSLSSFVDSLDVVWTTNHNCSIIIRRVLRATVLESLAKIPKWTHWMEVVVKNELQYTDYAGDEHTGDLRNFILAIASHKEIVPRLFDTVNESKHNKASSMRAIFSEILFAALDESRDSPKWELWMFRVLTRDLSSLRAAQADRANMLLRRLMSYGRPIIPHVLWAFSLHRPSMELWSAHFVDFNMSNEVLLELLEDLAPLVPELRDEIGGFQYLQIYKFVNYFAIVCFAVIEAFEAELVLAEAAEAAGESDVETNDRKLIALYDSFSKPFRRVSDAFNTLFRQYLLPDWKPAFDEWSWAKQCIEVCDKLNERAEGTVGEDMLESLRDISQRRAS